MRDLKIYIGIFSIFLVIYLVALYNQPKPVDWSETYSREDKIPFGTFVLHNRLKDIFPGSTILSRRKPFYNVFKEEQVNQGNYIIISGKIKLDEYDFKELVNYMHRGNSVFIATYYLNEYITDTLKLAINSGLKTKPKLKFSNRKLNDRSYSFDLGMGDQFFSKYDTAKAEVLGVNGDKKAVFLKYPFGDGALYLMPSPKFFTNYAMLKPSGADYAAKALSYLPKGGDIIWDDYPTLGSQEETSIFRVFFKHPELRYAYYIALFSLIAFVIFEMKRRQRIIPVITPLKNSTVEFVELVGRVYYQQRDHSNIAEKKITYLLEHIRSTCKINTTILDAEFNELLAAKTGIDLAIIAKLILNINYCKNNTQISDRQLIDLNLVIEEFYYKSR
jgi:hypothetical protein